MLLTIDTLVFVYLYEGFHVQFCRGVFVVGKHRKRKRERSCFDFVAQGVSRKCVR